MILTSGFVSELFRAANEIENLSISEVRLLLQRAIVTIRDLRESAGIPVDGTPSDAALRLRSAADAADRYSLAERTDVLLEAADLIRTLGIVIDSGTQVFVRPID
ncbi:hypothetical protein ELH96_19770 [Rhizobium leguminosarum]|nr:hypothetical protein ELH96_19770 [Rhizobium leguminosarum]